ncbi:MAG: dethiobiotin synthase [Verrucomicrobiales bacterium]|nr:dethiobiotin synthase [Verrucomicrobiales bacterium]
MSRIIFVSGNDTGVGKTVLSVLLIRHLRRTGRRAVALKPFCSGGREDAEALFRAQAGEVDLERINPWHFRAPLSPAVAARRERRRIELRSVMAHLRQESRGRETLVVEGAGGLLSPLGGGYSARDLIRRLGAMPLVVCPNRLGVLNQALLVLEALPESVRAQARLVLMQPEDPDPSTASNPGELRALLGPGRVFVLPRLSSARMESPGMGVGRILECLISGWSGRTGRSLPAAGRQ